MTPPIIIQPSDDGSVYHASFGGGAVIPHVTLQLIFWGPEWPQPPSGPSADEIVAKTQTLLAGPYMSGLLQYGIGLGSLIGHTFLPSSPGHPLTRDNWHHQIWDMIDNGTFPEPDDPGGRNLYMFVLPPNSQYEIPRVGGAHGYPWDQDWLTDVDYAWTGFVLGDPDINVVTTRLFHEIVEACTDPEDDGWNLDGQQHPNSEICDKCLKTNNSVDGIGVQGYWSNFDKACIIPTMFSLRRFMLMKGFNPTLGVRASKPPGISLRKWITTG